MSCRFRDSLGPRRVTWSLKTVSMRTVHSFRFGYSRCIWMGAYYWIRSLRGFAGRSCWRGLEERYSPISDRLSCQDGNSRLKTRRLLRGTMWSGNQMQSIRRQCRLVRCLRNADRGVHSHPRKLIGWHRWFVKRWDGHLVLSFLGRVSWRIQPSFGVATCT